MVPYLGERHTPPEPILTTSPAELLIKRGRTIFAQTRPVHALLLEDDQTSQARAYLH
jgi:hypothetical protein